MEEDIRRILDVPIPMRDGLNLACNIYLPDKQGKYPVIMAFTSFSKDAFWCTEFNGWKRAYEPWSPTMTGSCAFEANDPNFWCNYGYVVIDVDARGFNRSPGTGVLGPRIIRDGMWARDQWDAIEWAGVQEWSNGNVGLSGVSLLGFSIWRIAGQNPPHLKCINPWEAMTDFDRCSRAVGGIPETRFSKPNSWQFGTYTKSTRTTAAWPAPENEDPPTADPMEEDDFLEMITMPTLISGNWNDHGIHTRGSLKAFRKIKSEHKWLYTHGRFKWSEFYSSEARTFRKMFFDCFLKGTDKRILDTPRVSLKLMDTMDDYIARYEDDYPLKSIVPVKCYLDVSENNLKSGLPDKETSATYDSENGHVAFDYVFDGYTELIGPSALKLWVSTDEADDMDLFITLRKFGVDGKEVLYDSCYTPRNWMVGAGWMRLSHRELNPEISTPLEPYQKHVVGEGDKIKPGEIVSCEIPILAIGHIFNKGEKLRIEVSGKFRSGETLVRNDRAWDDLVNKGKHTIYTGGQYDSYYLMPVNKI